MMAADLKTIFLRANAGICRKVVGEELPINSVFESMFQNFKRMAFDIDVD